MSSVVYFIQCAEGPVKIGWSADLKRRRANLATPSGLGSVLATIPGGSDLEAHFHEMLSAHRMHGEWFRPDPMVLELADRIRSGAYVPPVGFKPVPRRITSRISLAKAVKESRDEARMLIGIIAGPKESGSLIKDVFPQVARATGIPASRIWDLWYRKASTVQSAEMDRLREAADKAKQTSADPERLVKTMRDLLSQLEQVTAALEALKPGSSDAASRVRRLATGE